MMQSSTQYLHPRSKPTADTQCSEGKSRKWSLIKRLETKLFQLLKQGLILFLSCCTGLSSLEVFTSQGENANSLLRTVWVFEGVSYKMGNNFVPSTLLHIVSLRNPPKQHTPMSNTGSLCFMLKTNSLLNSNSISCTLGDNIINGVCLPFNLKNLESAGPGHTKGHTLNH